MVLSMKLIKLSQSKFAIIDNKDFYKISKYKWFYNQGYAISKVSGRKGKRKAIRMHRLIIDAPPDFEVDHKDSNGLNNKRSNLRLCTRAQNCRNSSRRSDNTSGFKGVSYNKNLGKYKAYIALNGVVKHLGYFNSAKMAAIAYDKAAIELHGDFAKINL